MKSIKETIEYSWEIKKSTFITHLIPCDNEGKAKEIIESYRTQYHDASHNCVAYIINNAMRFDDDGEPSKTAGMPMLNVLQRQELTNIIAVVTRYFGGIKLGAGGLTRAYTRSVSDAIKEATIIEKVLVPLYEITVDYHFANKVEHLLKTSEVPCLDKSYEIDVTFACYIKDKTILDVISEFTNGNCLIDFVREDYIE